jgi:hypothetical protein
MQLSDGLVCAFCFSFLEHQNWRNARAGTSQKKHKAAKMSGFLW